MESTFYGNDKTAYILSIISKLKYLKFKYDENFFNV